MTAFLFSSNMIFSPFAAARHSFFLSCVMSVDWFQTALRSMATNLHPGNSCGVRSADGDLAHVDGDQKRLRDALVIALPGVAPTRGGGDDAVDVAGVAGVEHAGRPADDVDGEVMAAQQSVRAEARDLFA